VHQITHNSVDDEAMAFGFRKLKFEPKRIKESFGDVLGNL
jgi:hypothetical protein